MPVSDYTPTADEVAAVIRARTKDSNGNETGEFSSATRPTEAQATAHAVSAAQEVALELGETLPTRFVDAAKRAVAILAAADIERTYWPEQAADDGSTYRQLLDAYERLLRALRAAVDTAAGPLDRRGIRSVPLRSPAGVPIDPDDLP